MIVTVVRATAKAGKRMELQEKAEAICRNGGRCLEHELWQHPSDENAIVCLSKWRGLGPNRRGDPAGEEVLVGFMQVLTPFCERVAIELHAVSHTTRNETSATTYREGVGDASELRLRSAVPEARAPRRKKPVRGEEEVRIAERYLEAHVGEDLTVRDLAASACVSVRTMFRCFRRVRGRSPMKVLETARLERARQQLLEGRDGDTVTRVATDSGFTHLSRFSALYRRIYGEKPSQTLRRSQQRAKADETSRGRNGSSRKREPDNLDSTVLYRFDRRLKVPSSLRAETA